MRIKAMYDDLTALERDLGEIHRELMPEVRQVTSKGALNIKQGWSRRWEGHPTIRHLPRAINYDLDERAASVEAEIGPAHERVQGTLGHIIEFGKAEYGDLRNAPIPGGQPALDDEEPRYVRALAAVAEKVIGRRGAH